MKLQDLRKFEGIPSIPGSLDVSSLFNSGNMSPMLTSRLDNRMLWTYSNTGDATDRKVCAVAKWKVKTYPLSIEDYQF